MKKIKKPFDDISINTIIGPETFVHGDLMVPGFIRIDGDVDGDVKTLGRVIIGERARIRGNIYAASVTIGGMVQGDIVASKYIILLSSSVVLGDVLTRKLKVEDNVILHGFCSAIDDQLQFEDAERKQKIKKPHHSSAMTHNSR